MQPHLSPYAAADRRAEALPAGLTPAEREIEAATVLDSLQAHIALLDPQGVVVSVNRAWCEFGISNGASTEQALSVGMDYVEVCRRGCLPEAPEAGSAHSAAAGAGVAAVLAGTQAAFEMEYPCHGPADPPRWFLLRVTPLVGPRGGAVVVHEDITTRRLLEQHRADLIAELLTANRELSDFAYVVSHDLKAPLRSISSLASWLVSDYADKLGPDGCEQLVLIASRVKRLSGLIDAILAYSRAGRSRTERAPVALVPLLQNTIELLAPPPHIEVGFGGMPPQLTMEAVKIQQVFQNLLSNAIDFMDKPAGRVAVGCVPEASHWHFSVADNGPGIEPRHFERIFQLFQTLASRDENERTGVGLALVKKIVELEGGSIWVESVVGTGTTFHFTLPRAADALRD